MSSLPDISRADVHAAAQEILREGVPARRGSAKFCLLVDGAHLPPKHTVALAARRSLGRVLQPFELAGGTQTNSLLHRLGFEVVPCCRRAARTAGF